MLLCTCRRGAKEADELILELVRIADAVRGDTNKHMAHEEQEVLPLLEAHLCAAEQRAMVWRTLRAMPLRLLERVMPWVAGAHLHLQKCLLPFFSAQEPHLLDTYCKYIPQADFPGRACHCCSAWSVTLPCWECG